jgi:hypothetical protein
MSVYSNNALRVAVSSRALFDLRKEGDIFAEKGLDIPLTYRNSRSKHTPSSSPYSSSWCS